MTKQKIISLVVSCVIALVLVVGGVTFAIVKSKPQSGAVTGTETSASGYIGNLFTSSGINVTTYNSLLSKVGAIGSVSGQVKSTSINGGTPVIFQMGEINGNPIYWQVVYRTKDYITVWMTRPYTTGEFNPSSTDGSYLYNGNYSTSYLRRDTNSIYTTLSSSYSQFSSIVASPSAMASATGTSWQASQANTKYGSSTTSITNGLSTQTSTTNPHSWTWDSTVYNDMFWIPSYYEVHCADTSWSSSYPGDSDNKVGLWGLSLAEKGFSTATFKDSSVTASYCWLRSGSL